MYPRVLLRSLTYILIITLTLFGFDKALPEFKPNVSGIVLPANNSAAINTNPESVRLLPFSPNKYQSLGQVNVEMHVNKDKSNQDAVAKKAEIYAKQLAAAQGANAIVVTSYGVASFGEAASDSNFYVFRGTAVHLDKAPL